MLNDLTVTELRGVLGPVHVRVWTSEADHDEFGNPVDMDSVQWHYQVSVRSCEACPSMAYNGGRTGRDDCICAAKARAAKLARKWRAAVAEEGEERDAE